MRKPSALAIVTALAFLVVASGASAAPQISISPKWTASQLQALPGANWITTGGNIANQRYSSLNQITTSNVSQLKQAWHTNLDGSGMAAKYSPEATPIVHNGIIYILTGNNDIFALDATNGAHLWTYHVEHPSEQQHDLLRLGRPRPRARRREGVRRAARRPARRDRPADRPGRLVDDERQLAGGLQR